MSHHSIFRNLVITRRQLILSSLKATLFSLIAARLSYLQFIKHDKYRLLSNQNSISTIPIPPLRGEILDRNGNKIALNKQQFKLILIKPNTAKAKTTLVKIISLLKLSIDEQKTIKAKIHKNPFRATIANNLTWEQIVIIEQNIFDLDYASIVSYFARFYPHNETIAHPIGYTAKTDKIATLDIKRLDDFQNGKSGIEKYYDNTLTGTFGYKNLEVDAHGNIMRELEFVPSQAGENLILSIDAELQNEVYKLLPNQSGSIIICDLNTRQILSLVSAPNFQTNLFTTSNISQEYWRELNQDIKLPLFNKAIQAAYPPGSIFKIVTVLAALEAGMNPEIKVVCKPGGFLGDHFHCWHKSGHGALNMEQAIGCSCNYYMYHIAKTIGHKAIINTAHKLGLGQKVGIDLPGEVSGFLPKIQSRFDWKLANTLNLVIGQGLITTTPLQLSQLVNIIASKGQKMNLILKHHQNSGNESIEIDTKHFDVIHNGMKYAVNNPSGTAKAAYHRLISAAKTGTSQVQSKRNVSDDFSSHNTPWLQKNHALCVSFAPFDKPKYSVTVVVEHGGSGGRNAAPIVGKILSMLC